MAALALLIPLDMGPIPAGLLTASLLGLALLPSFPVPLRAGRILNTLGAATLFVYLLHEIFVFFLHRLQLSDPAMVAGTLVLSFGAGIVLKGMFDTATDQVMAAAGRRRGAALSTGSA